jgi:predicted nucleic acid binding AN1-type Zn finger protein
MKKVRKGEAFDGDIIKVRESVFDERWKSKKYHDHFVTRIRYYIISRISNNGNAYCYSHRTRGAWFNIYTDKRVIAVYRR